MHLIPLLFFLALFPITSHLFLHSFLFLFCLYSFSSLNSPCFSPHWVSRNHLPPSHLFLNSSPHFSFFLPGCQTKGARITVQNTKDAAPLFHMTYLLSTLFPHRCLLSLRACLSLASKAALVSIRSSSCRRIRAMSSWVASHCSLRAADSTLSCVAAMESWSLRSRHCICILLASFRRDSTLTATDSHWSRDMFWTEGRGIGGGADVKTEALDLDRIHQLAKGHLIRQMLEVCRDYRDLKYGWPIEGLYVI